MNATATVSGLRLDKYEATVARFRQFVDAVVGGWLPAAGAGKHSYLNGGLGLVDGTNSSQHESGWDVSWNSNLATTAVGWDSNLSCSATVFTQSWTPSPGSNENRAIDCVTWYEAYAFCIWDGGFLPSEAEWQFVAAGGSEQRVFPWSVPATSTTLDCAHANYGGTNAPATCCVHAGADAGACAPNDVGSESPAGDGKWGHIDLAGNAEEWNLDWAATSAATYPSSCTDCVNLTPSTARAGHGGGFSSSAVVVQNVRYTLGGPTLRRNYGVRCARSP
jgi:formylglycine-generating enzyme required for sulfatase activity